MHMTGVNTQIIVVQELVVLSIIVVLSFFCPNSYHLLSWNHAASPLLHMTSQVFFLKASLSAWIELYCVTEETKSKFSRLIVITFELFASEKLCLVCS